MKKWKKVWSLSLPIIALAILPIISISCTSSLNLKEKSFKQTKEIFSDVNQLQFKYEYIHTFSKTQYDFEKIINETPWQYNETIFKNNIFNIKLDSQNIKGEFYLDLYNLELDKWYFIKIYYNKDIDLKNLDKYKLANDICSIITNNFTNDVSREFILTNDLVLNESGNKSKILNNAYGSFKSSWGVWNGTSVKSKTQYIINEKMIRETSQIELNDDSYVFEEIKINDFYYLPLIEVIDPPVGSAKWTQRSLSINNVLVDSQLTNNTQNIVLPKNADSGQEWWKWFTNGKSFQDVVISFVSDLIASTVDIFVIAISDNPIAGFIVGEVVSKALDYTFHQLYKDNLINYNNNKMVIDDYNKTLNEKGYKTQLSNPILLDVNKDNILLLDSDVNYSAKATAIFGDRTKAKIYANPALAKTESKIRKYALI